MFRVQNLNNMENLFVPDEILVAFKEHYPFVSLDSVTWSWEVPGKIYEAEFELDGIEHEVEFTVTAEWLLTETEVDLEEVPEIIRNDVAARYPEFKIDETSQVEYSNGLIHYELAIEKDGIGFDVQYREDGMFFMSGEDL